MRYAIFSDIHANLEALEATIRAYQKESIEKYLCVGDIVGYGANPNECSRITRALAAANVAGNHDWAAAGLISTDLFNPLAKEAIFWTDKFLDAAERQYLKKLELTFENKDLTLVHGSLSHPEEFSYLDNLDTAEKSFALLKTQVCFIGHSHIPGVFILAESGQISYSNDSLIELGEKKLYIVNTGSVGQPRDGNPKAAYCIYDTAAKSVQTKRIDYDIKKAQEKILNAGLPRFLADRLALGR